ncbi:MAG TPA: bifunctional DNA-binding transcriptional regulator/O6-methylguanine-DNA methyltransferase Ada [Polyangiales bacterium]|nr:bifunctional DNA-binding transcriptional regulator/O6-methylguanine-DNA methyltransferase Ada [Polyangiales bacterium]
MTQVDLSDTMPVLAVEDAPLMTARHASAFALAPVQGRGAGARFATESARWAAVVRRDRSADGAFVYAVKTTGVYCRPGCASRRPLRKNVELFATPEQAQRAGYRACKRCSPSVAHAVDDTLAAVVEACRLLERAEGTRSDELAAAVGLSASYFARAFKRRVGVTPQAYRRRVLAERAKEQLGSARSVTRAVYDAGYASASRFYAGAARELGMTPSEAQQGGRGQLVRYVVRRCSLGHALVAWTERGVCEVGFGDDADEVTAALRARFPHAQHAQSDLPAWIDRVLAAVERPQATASASAAALDVPLDIRGTAFQQRVWAALRRIPAGETRSYTELARALGSPAAVRAVARACASNRVAVLVPCHRVVRADGSLSGYRWKPERKRALLQREARS